MSCPVIALDCKAVIALNDLPLYMAETPCYVYGTKITLNFNQILSGFSIPIHAVADNGIYIEGELWPNFFASGTVTIAGSDDGPLNNTWNTVSVSYNETTGLTFINIGYTPGSDPDVKGNITALLPCCYTTNYKVQNTDNGQIILEGTVTNCPLEGLTNESYVATIEGFLNTTGNVNIFLSFESCLGYQECTTDINICAEVYSEDVCHSHTIHFSTTEESNALVNQFIANIPSDIIVADATLNWIVKIYQMDSMGGLTLLSTTTYDYNESFDHVFSAPGDGVYQYDILFQITAETDSADSVLSTVVISSVIIDDCDVRSCWATMQAKEYCCNCDGNCNPSDYDCISKELEAKRARRNAMNIMSADIFMLLELTNNLSNQWTTSNSIYFEDYKNDLVKVYDVINHLANFIKNCDVCNS